MRRPFALATKIGRDSVRLKPRLHGRINPGGLSSAAELRPVPCICYMRQSHAQSAAPSY
ncbi:hypothetical protein [Paracoccus sp. MC1862]|uniref:hypothetical protein n=1 Tax=Paracoccus sp. MC1862 TaxID=2760307 RepID=UPI001604308A|nr:hypothetical protein [Paracoccus sp. MC1862]MBB1491843.1 hypothetical protein [Paracoccus sp. MC1854]MBB1496940.1 hypothetical protein [Paracoccus sp. MC1862]